jgi:hypothetical protein
MIILFLLHLHLHPSLHKLTPKMPTAEEIKLQKREAAREVINVLCDIAMLLVRQYPPPHHPPSTSQNLQPN